jgi:two-component system response regulator FixJ
MPKRPLVLVVEDDDAMRASLETVLRDAGHEVRAFSCAEDLLSAEEVSKAGCVVSDVRLPGMDGLGLLRCLRGSGSDVPVVLITGHGDVPLAVAGMKAGAADFLEKPFDAESLLTILDDAVNIQGRKKGRLEATEAARRRLEGLTPREHEVLARLVAGNSNKEAAVLLGLSPRTVEYHRANILAKTRAKGLPELIRLVLEAQAAIEVP